MCVEREARQWEGRERVKMLSEAVEVGEREREAEREQELVQREEEKGEWKKEREEKREVERRKKSEAAVTAEAVWKEGLKLGRRNCVCTTYALGGGGLLVSGEDGSELTHSVVYGVVLKRGVYSSGREGEWQSSRGKCSECEYEKVE